MNQRIRTDITMYRGMNTRVLINKLAAKHKTTKQRVCGNLSYLKQTNIISIYSNAPHSIVY